MKCCRKKKQILHFRKKYEEAPGGPGAPAPHCQAAGGALAPRAASCQFLAKFRQNFARFRLYRRRSLQENTRPSAFFKIYQII